MIRLLKQGLDLVRSQKYRIEREIIIRNEQRRYGPGELISLAQGNSNISNLIENGAPACIGKIGTTELKCLTIQADQEKLTRDNAWESMKMTDGRYFGGIYPDTPEIFEQFSRIYADALTKVDLAGVWYTPGEHTMVRKFLGSAEIVEGIQFLEPYFFDHPWSAKLQGKKVLIVSPFESTIRFQLEQKRQLIWSNLDLLPDFDFQIMPVPQNAGVEIPEYPDWMIALDRLKDKLSALQFDVAIIGAGAWSIPMAAFVKSDMGKIGIHMGGATQILFGIRGTRWDQNPKVSRFYNQHWTRLLDADKPDMEKVNLIPKGDQYW